MNYKRNRIKPFTIRLDHTYFPVWNAVDNSGTALRLYAEQNSGQMLMDIPAGEHNITLICSVTNNFPYGRVVNAISLIALFGIVVAMFGRKRFDKLLAS